MGITSKLDKHLAGSSILLWKINLLKQSLHVTMHAGWADFPHDVAKLMKDPAYREAIVRKSDLEGLAKALSSLRRGLTARVVFQIGNSDNSTHWCLLVGNPQQGVFDEIYGSLLCIDMKLIGPGRAGALLGEDAGPAQHPVSDQQLSSRHLEALQNRLASGNGLIDRLQGICSWDNSNAFDSLLFSDVQQAEDKVVVYGAGAAFADLKEGGAYPYEGTIAEMIVSLNLDHMIVEDTMESLKPIDWALFVPQGIRSYFAVPTFAGGTIRGVLIFCSSNANQFSEEQKDFFVQIANVVFSTQNLFSER